MKGIAMVPELVVDPEELSASATKVRGHGDDLDVGHATTDMRVSAACGGWAGESSQALTAWAAKLRAHTSSLVNRMGDHSRHMHAAVDAYGTNEDQRANDMAAVDRLGQAAVPNS